MTKRENLRTKMTMGRGLDLKTTGQKQNGERITKSTMYYDVTSELVQ